MESRAIQVSRAFMAGVWEARLQEGQSYPPACESVGHQASQLQESRLGLNRARAEERREDGAGTAIPSKTIAKP